MSDVYANNIRVYIKQGNDIIAGVPELQRIISSYSCPLSAEVERFLKDRAIEFTRRSQSVTYLALSKADDELLGYFAMAVKVLSVRRGTVSNTVWKKLLRTGEVDTDGKTITTPAYLIAQLGKNYADGLDKRMTGADLLKLACDKAYELQYMAGGVAVFVEADDRAELAEFYHGNREFCSPRLRYFRQNSVA